VRADVNRQIVLVDRPHGLAGPGCFAAAESEIPAPLDGQALVEVLYVAIDPAIRNWIDARGAGYLPAVELGEPVRAAGIGRVVATRSEKHPIGALVTALTGWQEYALVGSDMSDLPRLGSTLPEGVDPIQAVSVYSQSATTAYAGVERAAPPSEGEFFVVSAAASSVGSLAGQIARLRGARVIGIAGTDEKCRWVTNDLGFEACINYKREDVAERLKTLCPGGIDIFFDNVGGELLDNVLRRMAFKGRVILCGSLATDNATEPYRLRYYDRLMSKRATMAGFNVMDHWDLYPEALKQVGEWVATGQVQYRTQVLEGLDSCPDGLARLFRGDHLGKIVVRVASS
jgi:NADPH-dependent curcumin reductase CurA